MTRREATRRSMRICTVLGALAVTAMVLAHLALTDIHRGEGNLQAEWRMVQLAGLLVLAFVGSAARLIVRVRSLLSAGADPCS